MKKKIVQVLPAFNVGGAEALVKEYLITLHKNGYDVEALCVGARKNTPFENELNEAGIKMVFLSELYSVSEKLSGKLRHIVTALKWRHAVKKYFRQAKPDIVHCHLSVARSIVCAKKQLAGARMFYTVHSDPDKLWGNGKEKKELLAIKSLISHNGMRIIALHAGAVRPLEKYVGEECKICVLNNAIDFSKYKNAVNDSDCVRRSLGLGPDDFVIGHVGRFCEAKNHPFIIEVFAEVSRCNDKSKLVLVGDGELRPKIETMVKQKGLEDNVLFLGNRADIPDLLHSFDVFLFPSLFEGFPITMIEAQVAGLKCIVSNSITNDVILTNLVDAVGLEMSASEWAEKVLSPNTEEYKDKGLGAYDIHSVIQRLTLIYEI